MSILSIQPETFYSSEEVSEFLHLSLRTVQRLLHNHALPAYKIQSQYRIKGLDLLHYLDQNRQGGAPLEQPAIHLSHLLDVSPISIAFGSNWLIALDSDSDEKENRFFARLPEFRRHMIETLGFIVPGFRLKDKPSLAPNAYCVFIHDIPIFEGEESRLDNSHEALELLFKQLEKMIQRHAHELLSRDEVAVILEKLRESRPAVVEEVMHSEMNPNGLLLGQLTQVLRSLLKEQVSIRNFGLVLESLADHLPQCFAKGVLLDLPALSEKLRQSLSRQINVVLANSERIIDVITIDSALVSITI